MRFQNVEDYKNQRSTLMNVIEQLINEGKQTEAADKMTEVEKMDNDWNDDKVAIANAEAVAGRFGNLKNIKIGEGEQMVNEQTKVGTVGVGPLTNEEAYKRAFMNYVVSGAPIPSELINSNQNTKTGDVGAVIPNTILQKIIEKMEVTGQIYARVTKTSYKGGVTIPTSTVKPVATWVAEGATSDKQKKATGSVTFAYHKLRCAVSVSLEVDTVALDVLERTIVNNIAEAMVKAIEQAILNGTGSGQPKGIFTETVATGQNVDIAKDADIELSTIEAAEEALPLAYEAGAVWMMTKKTYLKAKNVKDENGQYIFKETRGVNGQIIRTLNERQVVLNDYMANSSDTVTKDTVVAALFNLEDYALNTNYAMGIKEYYDDDTEDHVRKSVMLVDGKVIDKNSLVTVTKKAQ